MDGRPEVVLFTFDAGGGHRAAARALVAAAEQQGAPFRSGGEPQDVLAPLDLGRRLTGRPMEETYNDMIRRRRTRFLVPMLRGLQWLIRRLRAPLEARVAAYLADAAARRGALGDPELQRGSCEAPCRRSPPGVPFLVLLTDFADFPPHFWMEPDVDGVIVATSDAAGQARALGLPAERVVPHLGDGAAPAVLPAGRARSAARRVAARAGHRRRRLRGAGAVRRQGLAGDAAALRGAAAAVARLARDRGLRRQPAPVRGAGRAPSAAAAAGCTASASRTAWPTCWRPATCSSPSPGPARWPKPSTSSVPVVVSGNAHTIPQERYNVRLVAREVLGVAVGDWREVPAAAAALAADGARLGHMRQNLAALPENRAVYEVLNIVERAVASRQGLPAA